MGRRKERGPMRDGFVRVAAVTPAIRVADVDYNIAACVAAVRGVCPRVGDTAASGAQVVVLPELATTAYTCEDLFWQDALLDAAQAGVARLARETSDIDALVVVGVPVQVAAKLYNCAAVLSRGRILGLVPKRNIPTYGEFYEGRHFCAGPTHVSYTGFAGAEVPFGARQLFACRQLPGLIVGVEVCEDLWVPDTPSTGLAQAGATLVCNLSASNEVVGKADYRRSLVSSTSARLVCAYAYASAGWGESTQDLVFGGHNLVCENGRVLCETGPFADEALARTAAAAAAAGDARGPAAAGEPYASTACVASIDVDLICADRRRMSTYVSDPAAAGYAVVNFELDQRETALLGRVVDPHPFVPSDPARRAERCETILAIQAHGLAKRLVHAHAQRPVVGVSGGLDSTLALLVCARALDLLARPHSGILAITMPGFGTTNRTHNNAATLAGALGCELREVDISAAVRQHFADIGHDEQDRSVTYENAQARERTQILMDVANQEGGLVVGTGDLSELALGWATYNADHMSMYGVNAGVPKTLVRHLVRYVADEAAATDEPALAAVLNDVLDTPVSPELLPAEGDGTISQRTEELIGPYELHDFFLYNILRCGFGPAKVYRLARVAFSGGADVVGPAGDVAAASGPGAPLAAGAEAVGIYDDATILRWLHAFYRRFFSQQFKRSCLPDGPKVGSVAVSPRGDLRMPSDACVSVWQRQLDELG